MTQGTCKADGTHLIDAYVAPGGRLRRCMACKLIWQRERGAAQKAELGRQT